MVSQLSLITPTFSVSRTLSSKTMKATFIALADDVYDVVLEINSNKFYITCEFIAQQFHSFEIIAAKGFAEISESLIAILRKVIRYFFAKM